jgi:hypothetical protein
MYNLITDPNDVVCNEKSAMADMKMRVDVQTNLWNAVMSLRNGNYYDCNHTEFTSSLLSCNLSARDSPDLMYSGEEGLIIKRLFATFSFRPTVVASQPIYPLQISNVPYAMSHSNAPMVQSVPMVSMRLPHMQVNNDKISLADALEQPQFYLENGSLVPKIQQIIYSDEIIVFYVNRRFQILNYGKMLGPARFSSLPASLSNLEKINDRELEFDNVMHIREEKFVLRSVVVAETKKIQESHLITGCSTLLTRNKLIGDGLITDTEYYHYNPRGANVGVPDVKNEGKFTRNPPIGVIAELSSKSDDYTFRNLASRKGTIFIYQSVSKLDEEDKERNLQFNY